MNAVRGRRMPFFLPLFSTLGVPLLGLGALILCLGNPPLPARPEAGEGAMMVLQDPSPRLDRSLSVCLRQQAREVARCRRLARPARLAKAVADYNLVARECTPAVFRATGLPPSLAQ